MDYSTLSFVRSVTMDSWKAEEVAKMKVLPYESRLRV
jgi:hypothetical protein